MNLGQARLIDPILTTHARGYTNPSRVGHLLFPRIDVLVRGGQVIEFGKEAFRTIDARRAPGSSTMTIEYGYTGKPFQLVQDALNAVVPQEVLQDASKVPGIDLGARSTDRVMGTLTLNLEVEQAALATNPANYSPNHVDTLAGADQWSDPASDPVKHIEDAKAAVRRTAGVEPNTMVTSKPVFSALKRHPKIVERYKYTTADSITADMLAKLFELDTLGVGAASVLDNNLEDDAPFSDIWGNVAVLAYVPKQSLGQEQPSFGYTYTLKGHPYVEQPYWDNDRKSWIYGVTYERVPVLTGISSGCLFRSVIAPAG